MVVQIDRDDVFMEAIFEDVGGKTELVIDLDIGAAGFGTIGYFPRMLTYQEKLEICKDLRTVPIDKLHEISQWLGVY